MESGGVAFLFALFATPLFIRFVARRDYGQRIREDGPATHRHKAGTPTMGGVVIMTATVLGYLFGHVGTRDQFTRAGLLVVGVGVASGILGLIDDVLGVRNDRNLGLNKRGKFVGQLVIALAFVLLAVNWVHTSTTVSFTRISLPGWQVGAVLWSLMAMFLLVSISNAVNFTDGVDGLAAGAGTFCFAVLGIIGYWEFRHPHLYHVAGAIDLAVVAVALVGGCLGFLWWNAAPARIVMGDTGSLAIGTSLGALCLVENLDLLLAIIGGLFVVEAVSVVMQIVSFRVFGRRIFRMAPIHHHFELRGWPETTVLIRFWILAGLLAALGLGIFYADFLQIAKFVK